MDVIKATYSTLVRIVRTPNVCVRCKRTERDLVGSTKNTRSNINMFSPESLCIDCEIRLYPDRFHGCGFCKRPIREKFSCTICSHGFAEWVRESMYPMDQISEMVKKSASDLVNVSIHNLPIIENRQFIMRTDDGYYTWPGFYGGVTNRFAKPDPSVKSTKSNKPTRSSSASSSASSNSRAKKEDIDISYITDSIDSSDVKYRYDDSNLDSQFNVTIDSFQNSVTDEDVVDVVVDDVVVKADVEQETFSSQSNLFPVWIIPRMRKQGSFDLRCLKLDLKIFQKLLLELLVINNINLYNDVQIDANTVPLEQIVKVNPYDTRPFKKS
ncbi:hypothetical protein YASMINEVIRUS_89 [Yasminevirus sp. GU-2018]|uniref:Uncharacterized protein n=1 Tax=Yasminevirus sp. GU-2018 TaxID=2420051 RepID=A0A5K0U927_9VIRU|nr:hypothetical protein YASMINEVIRUS_89 [Yasminevirus sp. GU-2018]